MPRPSRLAAAQAVSLVFCIAFAVLNPARAEDITVNATPVPLDSIDPARKTVGKLEWRGGVALASDSRRFGGLSGMLIENGGRELRAISDAGQWISGTLRYDARGMLVGLDAVTLDNLHDEAGAILQGGPKVDAESLTRLADGRLLVGFEREHRILAYPAGVEREKGKGLSGIPRRISNPPDLAKSPNNDGLEALATLRDGRVLALSEDLAAGAGLVRGWIGTVAGADIAWQDLAYRVVGPFRPTGAATLPNGDVVVTERNYNPIDGVRVRVMRLRQAAIVAGAVLEAEELARLIAPVITENLESIDAAVLPDGRVGLWIVADDNFNRPAQRTLLLHFVLND